MKYEVFTFIQMILSGKTFKNKNIMSKKPQKSNLHFGFAQCKQIVAVLILTLTNLLITTSAFSQAVGISDKMFSIDNSALLELQATKKGFLMTRLTTLERDSICIGGTECYGYEPAEGLIIFNTTTKCYEGYIENSWVSIACATACEVPNVPTAGTHVPDETEIVWNWNASTGATGYKWNTTNDYSTAIDKGSSTTHTETGLTADTEYTRYIWAYNSCGRSSVTTLIETTEAAFACGTVLIDSRDSKTYSTIQIVSQCWMAENLNYGTYVTIATGQGGAGTQKYCYSNNTANCTTYGGLYEWAEMMNGETSSSANPSGVQGICPDGWHLPSDDEWKQLEMALGMSSAEANNTVFRGTNEGGKLKQAGTTLWNSPNSCGGTCNTSGFTALPGGNTWSGAFDSIGDYGFWWSSTEYSAGAWRRGLAYYDARVFRNDTGSKLYGFSVRCIKD
jgi:uncharacterized protein (TIGR02145 family)